MIATTRERNEGMGMWFAVRCFEPANARRDYPGSNMGLGREKNLSTRGRKR